LDESLRQALHKHYDIFIKISLISFGLGLAAAVSTFLMWGYVSTRLLEGFSVQTFAFGLYLLTSHVVFHLVEFLVAARYRPHDTHPRAFMVLHSTPFVVATVAAITEFYIETFWVPEAWRPIKLSAASAMFFSLLTLVFYACRVIAMIQAAANFALEIEVEHRKDHFLVKTGLYAKLRHPAYFGWFWRTVCTQLILMNPICLVGFTYVTWAFFRDRIREEEELLLSPDFFGTEYEIYRKSTVTGIPLIP
jgi:protein-S-isoprenylcysteine O-methyltransferase